jgi:RNA polymerase sigma-70 factor (ECF subfamily)
MPEGDGDFAELMERVRGGSEEAVRELLDRYGHHILRVVRRRLHQRMRARFDSLDFVQDVWASFFAGLERQWAFDDPHALVAFLADLAYKKVVDKFRGHVEAHKREIFRERSFDSATSGQESKLVARQPTPSQLIVAKEEWTNLIEGQPELQQRILELLRQGNSTGSIARRLGVNVRTVRRTVADVHRLARARQTKKLRETRPRRPR